MEIKVLLEEGDKHDVRQWTCMCCVFTVGIVLNANRSDLLCCVESCVLVLVLFLLTEYISIDEA